MKSLAALALAFSLVATASAQQSQAFTDPANLGGERVSPRTGNELPIDSGTLGLEQLLRKLNTRASILNIVAHPDDEDGGMLTLYARGMGARVADLALTRGEGGQNAMTGDFEDALGLLRTQELLANDRYTGVTQMFGTEVDFGFSKTKSEAFAKWTHERVLYDVVRAIRIYRPLVITATFIGNPTDGHGQHQVSGEIAQEAFIAAGDPKVFPELTAEGILPWQPLKMYARVPRGAISGKGLFDYATNQNVPAEFTNYITHVTSKTPPTTDVIVHEGRPDPLLTAAAAHKSDLPRSLANSTEPMTYVQFARIGLGLQKSQIGPGERTAGGGAFDVHYHRYGSKLAKQPEQEADFFDGIDISLLGIQDLAPKAFPTQGLSQAVAALKTANEKFDPSHPEAVSPLLAFADEIFQHLITSLENSTEDTGANRASALHELRTKRAQANDALALSLGLSLDASTTEEDVVLNSQPQVSAELRIGTPGDFTVSDLHFQSSAGHIYKPQGLSDKRTELTVDHPILNTGALPKEMASEITRPYFSRKDLETPVYTVADAHLRNAPSTPPALTAHSIVDYKGLKIELAHVVHNDSQPVSIVPAHSVSLTAHAQLVPDSEKSFSVGMNQWPLVGISNALTLGAPGWKASPHFWGTPAFTSWIVQAPPLPRKPITLTASLKASDGLTFHEGYRAVGYDDLPRTNIFEPATDRIVPADLKLPTKRRIAFVPGTGDSVPEALQSVGLDVHQLKVSDLNATTLASYDTVILGVRTYNAHPDLHGAPTQALLDFARNGGNVVVQYQTREFTAADAPYPLDLGSDEKVVDETAPVALLKTQNSLLTTPNQITPADFNNWIEERGHGFMSTWDAHYTALTETHDPGSPSEHVAPQLPQRGGLLTVPLGKGRWTYVAFALYRQLPEAVPGAYRLFLNLLDNPR